MLSKSDLEKLIAEGLGSPEIALAQKEILKTYGDKVDFVKKSKALIKFGLNDVVGTSRTTVMQLEGSEVEETYATTNAIDKVVSSDNTFTHDVTIEGHTVSGTDLTFVVQTVTLTGQTAADLTTPLCRATRVYPTNGHALASASDKVFVYEDVALTAGVPNTDANVHVSFDGNYHQSQKASTAISANDYYLITKLYAGVDKKTAASVDIELRTRGFQDEAFRTVFKLPISTSSSPWLQIDAPPVLIIPKNSDVIVSATSSAANTEVIGGFAGYLAEVIG